MAVTDASFKPEVFRNDDPIVIAQQRHLATIVPVRLAYNASGYVAGRVVARNTTSTYFQNYDNGASSGLDTAAGVLFDSVDVTKFADSSDTQMARMIVGGEVYKAKLLGLDSAAETDLKARTIIDATGISVLKY